MASAPHEQVDNHQKFSLLEISPENERIEMAGRVGRAFFSKERLISPIRYLTALSAKNAFTISFVIGLSIALFIFAELMIQTEFGGWNIEGEAWQLLRKISADQLESLGIPAYEWLQNLGYVGFFYFLHATIAGSVIVLSVPLYLALMIRNAKGGYLQFDPLLNSREKRTFPNIAARIIFNLLGISMTYGMIFFPYFCLYSFGRGHDPLIASSFIGLILGFAATIALHTFGALLLLASVSMLYGIISNSD